jgi:hypothetical protein
MATSSALGDCHKHFRLERALDCFFICADFVRHFFFFLFHSKFALLG